MSEQEEINNLDKIHWERNSWKQLSLIGDETVINLQRAKVYVFSDSVLCFGRIHQHPESNEAWKKGLNGSRLTKATEIVTESMESRLNSSGTSSQDSQHCSHRSTEHLGINTRNFHRKNSFYVNVQRHFL